MKSVPIVNGALRLFFFFREVKIFFNITYSLCHIEREMQQV